MVEKAGAIGARIPEGGCKCAVAIPALNPPEVLLDVVDDLLAAGFTGIIVIDDGSDAAHKQVFDKLRASGTCTVLTHYVNMGKGRSIKDALNFYMNEMQQEYPCGIITADCDGQHLTSDIIKMHDAMVAGDPNALYLGVRDFDAPDVPPKSRFGNKCTRTTMRLLYGGRISDIMTGLRGITPAVAPEFIDIFGDRVEYEPNMLIIALRKKIPVEEVPITTVYFDGNKATTFNPLRDSWKIYKLMLGTFIKFVFSSLSSYVVDILCFAAIVAILGNFGIVSRIWVATVSARVISSLFNYCLNRKVVFAKNNPKNSSFWKYCLLVIAIMCCSAGGVSLLCLFTGIPEVIAKMIVDTLLFFASFQIQRIWVFKPQSRVED